MKKLGLSDALTAFLINKVYRENIKIREDALNQTDNDESNPFEIDCSYLLFECSQQYFAFEAKYIQDIVETDQVSVLSLLSDDIEGFCQIEGEIAPILDFNKIFNLNLPNNPSSETTGQKTLILNYSNKKFGFIVNNIVDLVKFPANSLCLDFPFDIPLKNVQAFKEYLNNLVCILEISMLVKEFPFNGQNMNSIESEAINSPNAVEEISNITQNSNTVIRP